MENLYKKPFPRRSFKNTVHDVLRMKHGTTKWNQFQDIAKQFKGGSLRPNRKLLPSSVDTIANIDSPSTLAALMHQEKIGHDDYDHEFHMGGGITEAVGSIFSALWGMTGKAVYNHWYGHHESDRTEGAITPEDREYARAVSMSYRQRDDREDVGDWELLPEHGTDRFAVFRDGEKIHVALRGTRAEKGDLWRDAKIIYHNNPGDDEDIKDQLVAIARAYPDAELDVSAHSLGSNQLVNAFEGYDDNELGRYDRINLYNPGTSPFSHLDTHKEAVDDDRVHLYLNTGDILSNTYTYLIQDDRANVTYADAGFNPISNHSLEQWTHEEQDKAEEEK